MSYDEAVYELGGIAEEKDVIPIFIVAHESCGDGSCNWTDNDRPQISVFTDQAKLEEVLMQEEKLGPLAVRRAIRLGGIRTSENNGIRITCSHANRMSKESCEWKLPCDEIGFIDDLDIAGAATVLAEFLYTRDLVFVNCLQRCEVKCCHSHFTYREASYRYYSDKTNLPDRVVCSCGFQIEVGPTCTQEWPKYISKWKSTFVELLEQPWELRKEDAQRHWRFQEIKGDPKLTDLFAIPDSNYVAQNYMVAIYEPWQVLGHAELVKRVIGRLVLIDGIVALEGLVPQDAVTIRQMGLESSILPVLDERPTGEAYTYQSIGITEIGKPPPVPFGALPQPSVPFDWPPLSKPRLPLPTINYNTRHVKEVADQDE